MTPDETAPVRDRRPRPWWLVTNTPGRAIYVGLLSTLQGWLLLTNNRRDPLPTLLLIAWAALIAAFLVGSVVTAVAFRRHPDWIGKVWPKRALTRRAATGLAQGVAIGAATTVVGLIVSVVTASGAAIAVTLLGFSVAAGCGATLSFRRSPPSGSNKESRV